MTRNHRRYSRMSYHSFRGSSRSHHDETGTRRVCSSKQAGVRRSRINDDSDIRRRTEARCDVALDLGRGLAGEDRLVLRVTGSQLWKQHIHRIEVWDDVTHDQTGAKIIGDVVRLSQSFVRCCCEIRTDEDWSVELHHALPASLQPDRLRRRVQRDWSLTFEFRVHGRRRLGLVRWVGEQLDERLSDTRRDVHDDMPAVQLAWMRQPACVSDHLEVALEGKRVVVHSHSLVRGVQTCLKPSILRRHSGRARVRMAAHRLDAPDRKQKTAADMYEVSAKRDMDRDFATGSDLAGCNQGDVIS